MDSFVHEFHTVRSFIMLRLSTFLQNEQERVPDYENIIDVHVAKVPNSYDYDTSETSDTSEDEVEVSYTQVNFKSKSEHRRANSSSSSSEDDTQYSQVKI